MLVYTKVSRGEGAFMEGKVRGSVQKLGINCNSGAALATQLTLSPAKVPNTKQSG